MFERRALHYVVIIGIDSPKPGQLYFNESRDALNRLLRGKQVRVVVEGRDDFERELARVYIGERDVALEMVRLGHVWYGGDEFEGADEYQAAHATAKSKKIGLWQRENPVAPWDFQGPGF